MLNLILILIQLFTNLNYISAKDDFVYPIHQAIKSDIGFVSFPAKYTSGFVNGLKFSSFYIVKYKNNNVHSYKLVSNGNVVKEEFPIYNENNKQIGLKSYSNFKLNFTIKQDSNLKNVYIKYFNNSKRFIKFYLKNNSKINQVEFFKSANAILYTKKLKYNTNNSILEETLINSQNDVYKHIKYFYKKHKLTPYLQTVVLKNKNINYNFIFYDLKNKIKLIKHYTNKVFTGSSQYHYDDINKLINIKRYNLKGKLITNKYIDNLKI